MGYLVWSMLIILICTVTDIKDRNINIGFCVVNILSAAVIHIVMADGFLVVCRGMILGVILIIVSLFSRGAIGRGDGLLLMTVGSITGLKLSIMIAAWAFISCTAVSLVAVVAGKLTMKSQIPFAPFILIGALIVTFIRYVKI